MTSLAVTVSPVEGSSNLLIVINDVSSLKQAEQTIRDYAGQLEQRNSELDAFSRTVAHDLQAPLNTIAGYTELVLMDGEHFPPDSARMLAKVQESAHRMAAMIRNLLLLARLKDISDAVIPVDSSAAAQAAIERFPREISERRIDVGVQSDLPPCLGQRQWIEEIFANLLSNAIKYIGKDNPAPRITIRGQASGGITRYEVEDNGLGIDEAAHATLFEAFSRFHTHEASGMGLGLSIVLRIVRRLNGDVGVISTPGQGSVFWFSLPTPTPADYEAQAAASEAKV